MKKFVKSKLVLQIVMASLVATLVTAGIVGATTIGANITTTGTLGAATTTISSGDLVVDTNALIVKYLENKVGMGTTTPFWVLSVTGTASQLALAYDNAGYALFDVDASDDLTITASGGDISFGDENVVTTGTFGAGATTFSSTLSVTGNVSHDGGTYIFNDSGADKDFRIESSGEDNLFFTDGGNDRIGIATATPGTILDIYSTATTTITIDTISSTQGGCLKMRDIDGAGYSYGTVLDGAITWSGTSCE